MDEIFLDYYEFIKKNVMKKYRFSNAMMDDYMQEFYIFCTFYPYDDTRNLKLTSYLLHLIGWFTPKYYNNLKSEGLTGDLDSKDISTYEYCPSLDEGYELEDTLIDSMLLEKVLDENEYIKGRLDGLTEEDIADSMGISRMGMTRKYRDLMEYHTKLLSNK